MFRYKDVGLGKVQTKHDEKWSNMNARLLDRCGLPAGFVYVGIGVLRGYLLSMCEHE